MVEEGKLDPKEKISSYWPEFGQMGKENLKVEDLMRHEAGFVTYNTKFNKHQMLTESIKKNQMGKCIEKDYSHYMSPEKLRDPNNVAERIYHPLRDFVTNEIFRRVEPQNRTMGEYFRDEFSKDFDIHIGVTTEEAKKRSIMLRDLGFCKAWSDMQRPLEERFSTVPGNELWSAMFLVNDCMSRYNKDCKDKDKKLGTPFFDEYADSFTKLANDDVIRQGECPAGFISASARGLAKMGAAMANKGKIGEVTVLSEEGWTALHAEPTVVAEPLLQ